MRLRAALFGLLVVAASCGGEPGPEEFAASLAEANPALSAADVDCIVAELGGDYTDAELAALIDSNAALSESESAGFADAQFAAVRACNVEGALSPALIDGFATANDLTTDVAGCAVGRLQEQFGVWELADQLAEESASVRFQRRQLEAIFECGDRTEVARQLVPQLADQGVGVADAECVAEGLAASMAVEDLAVLYTGQTTDRFFELYFDAVEDCGALPEQ